MKKDNKIRGAINYVHVDDREKDIQVVCKAVLDNWLREYENWYDSCIFCGTDQKFSEFRHKVDCPVLIAKDLMTGYRD